MRTTSQNSKPFREMLKIFGGALFACCSAALAPSNAAEIYIDDFSTPQVISGLNLSGSGYVSGPGIIGTERDAEAYAPSIDISSTVPGEFLAFNAHPVNWGTLRLTYDGVDRNTSGSFLGGLDHVDLTAGGINDRFRIGVTSANHGGGTLTLTVRNVFSYGSSITVPLPTSAGVLDLRFTDFEPAAQNPINFADVGLVQLSLGLNPGESYTFDGIVTTVPEPSSVTLLVVAGMAGLYLRGRNRARRHSPSRSQGFRLFRP